MSEKPAAETGEKPWWRKWGAAIAGVVGAVLAAVAAVLGFIFMTRKMPDAPEEQTVEGEAAKKLSADLAKERDARVQAEHDRDSAKLEKEKVDVQGRVEAEVDSQKEAARAQEAKDVGRARSDAHRLLDDILQDGEGGGPAGKD